MTGEDREHPSGFANAVVFLVDDDPSVRKGLSRLIGSAGFKVEAFASAEDFMRRSIVDAPGCMVLDIRMPGMSGLELQEALSKNEFGMPIIFITGHGDVPSSVRAMKRGAVDFLSKPVDEADLLNAIHSAIARHIRIRKQSLQARKRRSLVAGLTPREREVFAFVAAGMPNKWIAAEFGITVRTVKAHRAKVMHKLKARSLADLVLLAGKQ